MAEILPKRISHLLDMVVDSSIKDDPSHKVSTYEVELSDRALRELGAWEIEKGLRRFIYKDWGAITNEEVGFNTENLTNNFGSIFSRYITRGGDRFYLIQDIDEGTLSILTSEEYHQPTMTV
tara:strand:+ start:81 stop:446 length:366 start_codon:yes stop_codon:yes gene_type:complete